MITKNRGSSFIRRFGGPGEDSQIVCFRFWQLVVADNGLRNAAKANGRDETIFDYLTEEKDPSGFKYRIPFDTQVEMFRFAINKLKGSIKPALCKEDKALWKALGMRFDGCHCLLGRSDTIVKERNIEMKRAREIEPVIGIGKPLPVLA